MESELRNYQIDQSNKLDALTQSVNARQTEEQVYLAASKVGVDIISKCFDLNSHKVGTKIHQLN